MTEDRQASLLKLFRRQDGKCAICGEPAVLDGNGGKASAELSACRFRTGSSYGAKGRRRPRVMAHRKCAQERSDQITISQPIDETRSRAGRFPSETYEIKQ